RDEVEPIVTAASFRKTFPTLSPYYRAFKAAVQGNAFRLLPATDMGDMPEWTITKREVGFYDEHVAHRFGLVPMDHGKEPQGGNEDLPTPLPPEPAEVEKRRLDQLDRFYPVTLIRLHHNKDFEVVAEALKAKGF